MTKHLIALVRLAGCSYRILIILTKCIERFPLDRFITAIELFIQWAEMQGPPADAEVQPQTAPPEPDPDPLYGAKYAADRIGVVDRTLYRLTERGLLPVHSYALGMRQFRHSDIERCRRYYRGE